MPGWRLACQPGARPDLLEAWLLKDRNGRILHTMALIDPYAWVIRHLQDARGGIGRDGLILSLENLKELEAC